MRILPPILLLLLRGACWSVLQQVDSCDAFSTAFTTTTTSIPRKFPSRSDGSSFADLFSSSRIRSSSSRVAPPHSRQQLTTTAASVQDLDVIALVAGQENYGLAFVCFAEGLWSFVQAPSLSHLKVLLPATVAAIVLVAVSGPMITNSGGDASVVSTGLWISTLTSIGLIVSYVARLLAPFSPSPKEAAALGLLVAVAGLFSFGQNLVVDGFVSLPSLPSLPAINVKLDLGL